MNDNNQMVQGFLITYIVDAKFVFNNKMII